MSKVSLNSDASIEQIQREVHTLLSECSNQNNLYRITDLLEEIHKLGAERLAKLQKSALKTALTIGKLGAQFFFTSAKFAPQKVANLTEWIQQTFGTGNLLPRGKDNAPDLEAISKRWGKHWGKIGVGAADASLNIATNSLSSEQTLAQADQEINRSAESRYSQFLHKADTEERERNQSWNNTIDSTARAAQAIITR